MLYLGLLGLSMALFLVNLDFTIVNLALPQMIASFNSTLSVVKWVITGYTLIAGIFVVIAGRISDLIGLKKVFIAGLLIFIICSFLCAISQSAISLIIFRCLQGLGFASCFPLAFAMTSKLFEGPKQSFALGLLNAVAGITLAVGPTLGGVILHFLNWRWFFYINIPFGVIGLILTLFCVRIKEEKKDEKMCVISSSLYVLGLFLIMLAINQMIQWGIISWQFIGSVTSGLLLLVLFWFREKKSQEQIIDQSVLKNKGYLNLIFMKFCIQFIFFGIFLFAALYYQNILGYSALKSGLIILTLTAAFAISSPIVGKLIDHIEPKPFFFFSLLLSVIGLVLFFIRPLNPYIWVMVIGYFCIGFSLGVMNLGIQVESVKLFGMQKIGTTFGLIFTIIILSGAIGSAVTSYTLSSSSKNVIEQSKEALSKSVLSKVEKVSDASQSKTILGKNNAKNQSLKLALTAFYHAYDAVIWLFVVLASLATLSSLLYRRKLSDNLRH